MHTEQRNGTARPMGISRLMIGGGLVVAAFLGIVFGWANLAPLDSAAIAAGTVKVDSNRKSIQHLEGGIVGEIMVRDGDRVAAGDVLVVLDATQAKAAQDLHRARRVATAARLARLVAERDGSDKISFDVELQAQGDDPAVREALRVQTDAFDGRRTALAGQTDILEQRMAQSEQEIQGLKQQIAAQTKEYGIVTAEIADVEKLLAKGLTQKPRLIALQKNAAQLEGLIAQNRSRVALARQQIVEAQLRAESLKRDFAGSVIEELQQAQAELNEVAERERAARDVLARTRIRSPFTGTVVNAQIHSAGAIIAPGATLMEIVPENDRLVVEARVDPRDIDVVHVGLPAKVRFTAFSQRNTSLTNGTVTYVSADSLIDERSGQAYYLARVATDAGLADLSGMGRIFPGMQAEVMIATGERTMLDYFLKPIEDSFRRAMTES